MERRLDKTLADYIGIAISPALIMVMVGSLVFFLVALFYQGQYEERLHFVLALFVMAIVLVARLSIEFGSEHAAMYGAALAIVTALALLRFVDHGFFINIGLMALVWWSAHKLTWDCTLVDETEDASGEGLLQSAGLQAAPEPGAVADSENGAQRPASKSVWQRVRERFTSKGPHAPGVWIVYFSLAALPLFAIGEAFLPDDPARRSYAFRLLFLYVASGLALLMTTSFLGLRRYLRQRRLQMPGPMAGSWLALGSVMVVALVLFAALLPRPSGDSSRSNIRLVFDSPERQASDHAMLDGEGGKGEGAQGGTGEKEDAQQQGPGQSDQPGGSGGERKDGQSGNKEDGQGGGKQSSQSGGSSQSQQQSGSQSGEQGNQTGGKKSEQSQGGEQEPQQGEGQGKQQEGGGKQGESKQQTGGQPGEKQGDSQEPSPGESGQGQKQGERQGESRSRSQTSGEKQAQRQQQQKSEAEENEEQQEEQQAEQSGGASPPRESQPQQSFMPRLELGSGWFTTLLRWLLYAVLAGAALVWAWRNRAIVAAALADMLQVLRDFWRRLFGGSKPDSPPAEAEQPVKAPPLPRFAAYTDPFAAGTARGMRPDELVRYTFEAMEAWARDHGSPREPDQTPHEFARAIAVQSPQLERNVRRLAELYSQAAYAPGTLPASRVAPLQELWQDLRAADASWQAS